MNRKLTDQFLQSAIPEDVQPVYGKNYHRLLALKKKIDPQGFFCHSMFPRPNAPDEWDQLPPLTQARMRRAKEEEKRVQAKLAGGNEGVGKAVSKMNADGEVYMVDDAGVV